MFTSIGQTVRFALFVSPEALWLIVFESVCVRHIISLPRSFVSSCGEILLVRLDATSYDVHFNFHASQTNLSRSLMMTHGGDNN